MIKDANTAVSAYIYTYMPHYCLKFLFNLMITLRIDGYDVMQLHG